MDRDFYDYQTAVMITSADKETIETFIELVEELGESKYVAQARQGGQGSALIFSPAINGALLARSNPDRDHLKAAILTIRFFCQDNEPTSLRNMDTLIQRLPVELEVQQRFSHARAEFNAHLAKPPAFGIAATNGAETCGDIFNAFLYGEFAHGNRAKRMLVKEWKSLPHFDGLRSNFDVTLLTLISAIAKMRRILIETIEAPDCATSRDGR